METRNGVSKMCKTEFIANAHTYGRETAEYLAAELGICRAVIELWAMGV